MATQPSIAMIPAGYKALKLYSQLPVNGNADLDVARASSATRVNQNGNIELVANNVPRLDYSDGSCPSLLSEPQSTNLITYSEDFSNVAWNKSNVTLDSYVWANGFSSSAYFGDNTVERSIKAGTAIASTEQTLSFFIIMDDLGIPIIGANQNLGDFTLQIAGSNFATPNDVKHLGNNIYRVSATFTTGVGGLTSNGIVKYTTQSNRCFRVIGAQLEEQSYETSYIPTSGATATRLQDEFSRTGLGSVINSSEGVLYVEMSALADDRTTRFISLQNASATERVTLAFQNFSDDVIEFRVYTGGVSQINLFDLSNSITNMNKIAVKWSLNNFSLWVNGVEEQSVLIGNVPVGLDELRFDLSSTSNMNAKIKDLRVYDTILTDTELATLTT